MADKRNDLIEASFHLFYEKGFHACGVELLAQNAGTTKRTLYSYFPSKEALIVAVLAYRHAQFTQGLKDFFAHHEGDVVSKYLDFLDKWTTEPHFNGCLFINACAEYAAGDDPIHAEAISHKQAVRAFLQQQFILQGNTNAQLQADTLFLLGEGLIVDRQTSGEGAVTRDTVREIAMTLLRR